MGRGDRRLSLTSTRRTSQRKLKARVKRARAAGMPVTPRVRLDDVEPLESRRPKTPPPTLADEETPAAE